MFDVGPLEDSAGSVEFAKDDLEAFSRLGTRFSKDPKRSKGGKRGKKLGEGPDPGTRDPPTKS